MRIKYPAAIFNSFNFEISEEGTPFWIVPIESHTIGLFGGVDIHNVLIVNAITGNVDEFAVEKAPEWIDNVYNSNLIISQYDDFIITFLKTMIIGFIQVLHQPEEMKVTLDLFYLIKEQKKLYIIQYQELKNIQP